MKVVRGVHIDQGTVDQVMSGHGDAGIEVLDRQAADLQKSVAVAPGRIA